MKLSIITKFICCSQFWFPNHKRNGLFYRHTGPHFLCWISGVVPFTTWLISSWEELSNWQNDNYVLPKWQLCPFWVKYMTLSAFAQLVTTFIFFSAWDKSRVKWDNSQNSTQKMRTTDKARDFYCPRCCSILSAFLASFLTDFLILLLCISSILHSGELSQLLMLLCILRQNFELLLAIFSKL